MNRNRNFKQLYGRLDMVDLDGHEKYYGSLGLADPFTVETKQGNPILLDGTKERPFEGMRIFGKSTQDGTPSPENPIPIVSAGSVMTTGAQLLNANVSGVSRGVTYQVNGSIVHFSGITNESTGRVAANVNMLDVLQAGKTYYAKSFTDNVSADFAVIDNDVDSYVSSYTVTGTETIINFRLLLDDTNNISGINVERAVYGGVTENQNMESWEPYTGGIPGVNPYEGEINVTVSDGGTQSQILTISTPGGLPGIPVSSGGNYTDAGGQQWVCDEIDLARGKYVQRVGIETINGGYNFVETSDAPGRFLQNSVFTNQYKNGAYGSICNIALWSRWSIGKHDTAWVFAMNYFGYYLNPPRASGITTADELNAFLNSLGFPLVFAGQLATPIETDLPAEEIAAYKALHTYSPTTTVGNDADTEMEIKYKKYPVGGMS